ncbi:hypothetical protein HUG17_3757 [Dermatophagoides farinae]|uniref:Uncharacterized protein n=1 Tax=Dermatophagoides farinae TaxID=6954 RepID=A0A9D4NX43_DERFA|nr:hypothetical protein HUG17_3757 [Dermatophagoides farinae]
MIDNNDDDDEKNYLLKWQFITSGYFGAQMKTLQFSSLKSIINAIINLTLNGIIFYSYVIKRYFEWEIVLENSNYYDNRKFHNFILIFSTYYCQIFWLFITIYHYIYLRSIVQSMSSSIFQHIYRHKYHLFTISGITSIIMAPVTMNEFYAIFFGTKSNIFETLYSVLIRYCINNQFLVPMMIMTYVKYATIVSLKSIITIDADDVQHHHGRRKSSKWIKKQLDNERIKRMKIKQLAVMNRYFSRMLSPLLLFCVISYNLDMITFFFWQLKRSRFFFNFLTLTSFWNYFAYIVFLDNRIEKLLEKIIKNVTTNSQFKCCGQCHQYRLLNRFRLDDDGQILSPINSFYCSQIAHCIEFYNQYSEDFHMNVFDIFHLNFVFMFDSCLFAISFIILSLQTL